MTRKTDPAIEAAAKQREEEMKPTPVVNGRNPVEEFGTTEVPVEQARRERFEASERQKDRDIKQLEKNSDGKPKA